VSGKWGTSTEQTVRRAPNTYNKRGLAIASPLLL